MASLDDLNAALLKADAAGDAQSAQLFAGQIRAMRQSSAAVDTMPTPNPAATQGTGLLGNVSDFLTNMNAGVGGAITRAGNGYQSAANSVGQGIRSLLPNSVNSALDSANTALGLSTANQATQATNASIADHAQLDKPLNATVGGKFGDAVGTALTQAPAALTGAGLVPTIAANTGLAALLTPGDPLQRGLAGLGGGTGAAGGMAIGSYLGRALSSRLASSTAAGDAAAAQNATRDATLQMGRDNGLVVPPATINQGIVPSALEGIGGKIKTAQSASVKNQPILNNMARSDLGIAADTPLTQDTLQSIRADAGKAYDAVAKTGPLVADPTYTAAVQGLGKGTLATEFPELANGEIAGLSSALDKPGFSADSAVELTKKLRFDGNANKALQDPAKKALGGAQLEAAQAVEGLLDRNLQANGQGDLLKQFQDARMQIAKTYTLGKALNDSTGNVIASKLASQLAKGKPLSGGLEQIAQFAQAFPKAAQEMTSSTPMFTAMDAMTGSISGSAALASHGPLAGLAATTLPLARPIARGVALSGLAQRLLASPQYGPGLIGRQVPQIADSAFARALLKYGSAGGTADALQQ